MGRIFVATTGLACLLAALAGCSAEPARLGVEPRSFDGSGAPRCDYSGTVSAAGAPPLVATFVHTATYVELDDAQLEAARTAAQELFAGDAAAAQEAGARAGYRIRPLATPSGCDWFVAPTEEAPPGQAFLIVRPAFGLDMAVEAPHVPTDRSTDAEAAILFDQLRARALLVAGAPRCASARSSGCLPNFECSVDGTPFESDPSHSVRSAFHAFHLALPATTLAMQLHTNVKPALNGDVLASDGTRLPAAADSVVETFGRALAKETGADVRTCNDAAAPPLDGAFCGETNAQAMATNGAVAGCTRLATAAGGHFLHVEQSSARLVDVDGWSRAVALALGEAALTPVVSQPDRREPRRARAARGAASPSTGARSSPR